MRDCWFTIARHFLPELASLRGRERTTAIADVICTLYMAPLVLAGFAWLLMLTDFDLFRAEWPFLVFLFALLFVLQQFDFFVFIEVQPGVYADWAWCLWSVLIWSAVLLYGPTALWIAVLWRLVMFVWKMRKADEVPWRWNIVRNLLLVLVEPTLAAIMALEAYRAWGGVFPLPGLTFSQMLPAFGATLVWLLLSTVIWLPMLWYFSRSDEFAWTGDSWKTFVRFIGVTSGWRILVDPFAVLASGLYTQHGVGIYVFFIGGLLLGSVLAHKLSQVVDLNNLRSRELGKLELLSRAILESPPDASTLPALLQKHVSMMFPFCHLEIRIFPDAAVLHDPDDWPAVDEVVWQWVKMTKTAQNFLPGTPLPWGGKFDDRAVLIAPIVEDSETRGGIYLVRYRDFKTLGAVLPAVQSLAALIASTLRRAEIYRETLAHQRAEQELALAGRIQKSFLPLDRLDVPGWDIATSLDPARQVSGDFYDLIPLPGGLLAIVVADVSDKGMGAALYMALSRTLIRTYALEHADRPEFVMELVNKRMLADAHAGFFVTVFYGILDPERGTLAYCNAGHNPPYFVGAHAEGGAVRPLRGTGMALGVLEDATWTRAVVQFAPGDRLLLYTDGVTDAQDAQGRFFGKERLLALVQDNDARTAQAVQARVLCAVQDFVGDAVQFDDITLMVIMRDLTKA